MDSSNIKLDDESFPTLAIRPLATSSSYLVVLALGILVTLAGLYITLAAFKLLPLETFPLSRQIAEGSPLMQGVGIALFLTGVALMISSFIVYHDKQAALEEVNREIEAENEKARIHNQQQEEKRREHEEQIRQQETARLLKEAVEQQRLALEQKKRQAAQILKKGLKRKRNRAAQGQLVARLRTKIALAALQEKNQQLINKLDNFYKKYSTQEQKKLEALQGSSLLPRFDILCFMLGDLGRQKFDKGLPTICDFFKHYINLYVQAVPEDRIAQKILEKLNTCFFFVDVNQDLPTERNRFTDLLKREKCVIFEALPGELIEFFFDEETNTVSLETTQGHNLFYPLGRRDLKIVVEKEMGKRYLHEGLQLPDRQGTPRRLHRKGALLDSLSSSGFLEALLSFARLISEENLQRSNQGRESATMETLHRLLLYGWPGEKSVSASQLGVLRTSNNGCQIRALIKWIRFSYPSASDYLQMYFWIKLAGFSQYVRHIPAPAPQFLSDSLHKLGTLAAKLMDQGHFSKQMLDFLEDTYQFTKTKIQDLLEIEEAFIPSLKLEKGLDLPGAVPLLRGVCYATVSFTPTGVSKDYTHRLPIEGPIYEPLLTGKNHNNPLITCYKNPIYEEMVRRLNFLRLLPDFEVFNLKEVSNDSKEQMRFLKRLGRLLQQFFYSTEGAQFSLHIYDSFLPDLLNGWIILYRAAQQQNKIDLLVFTEWINGLETLLTEYAPQLCFDSSQARNRFLKCAEWSRKEALQLSEEMKKRLIKEDQKPHFLWRIWRHEEGIWAPYQITVPSSSAPRSYSNPNSSTMARFTYKEAVNDRLLRHRFYRHTCDNPSSLEEVSFYLPLSHIPFFNDLRCALGFFFVVFERHLSALPQEHPNRLIQPKTAMNLSCVTYEDIRRGRDTLVASDDLKNCQIKPWFKVKSCKPGVQDKPRFYPSYCLPEVLKKAHLCRTSPQRIHQYLLQQQPLWPFLTEEEAGYLLTFVFRTPESQIVEGLKFVERFCLDKLHDPDYQMVFEYIFWGPEGSSKLDTYFDLKQTPAEVNPILLFEFILRGYATLTKRTGLEQRSSGFLLHIHFRLCHMKESYGHSDREAHWNELLEAWAGLILHAQANPGLAKSLGESVCAAMTLIESSSFLLSEEKLPTLLKLLMKTLFLECQSSCSVKSRYDPLLLHYGYCVFNRLLEYLDGPTLPSHNPPSILLWNQALSELLGTPQSCDWSSNTGLLILENPKRSFSLITRSQGQASTDSLQPLPEWISSKEDYKTVFGNLKPLAHLVSQEGEVATYLLPWKDESYQIQADTVSKDIYISKKFFVSRHDRNLRTPVNWKIQTQKDYMEAQHASQKQEAVQEIFFVLLTRKENYLPEESALQTQVHLWTSKDVLYPAEWIMEHIQTGVLIAQSAGDRDTTSPIYRIEKNLPTGEVCGKLPKNDLLKLFKRIASSKECLVWMKPGNTLCTRIDLPALGLCFVLKGGQLHSLEYPNFVVAFEQDLPFLKSFQGCLILENTKGQKKVLVPARGILCKPAKHKKTPQFARSTAPSRLKGDLRHQPLALVTYDLGEEGQTHPDVISSGERLLETLMLIYIYLETQQYSRALELIRSSSLLSYRRTNNQVKTLLVYILDPIYELNNQRDYHPYAISLRTHLLWWVTQLQPINPFNNNDYMQSWPPKRTVLNEELQGYLACYQVLPKEFHLKPNQLKRLLSYAKDGVAVNNLRPTEMLSAFFYNWEFLWSYREAILNNLQELSLPSLTHPQEEFFLNFLHYYRMAHSQDETSKRKLKRILAFSHNKDAPREVTQISNLLKAALLGCPDFPTPDEVAQIFSLKDSMKNKISFNNFFKERFENPFQRVASNHYNINYAEWMTDSSQPVTFEVQNQKTSILPPPPPSPTNYFPLPLITLSEQLLTSLETVSIEDNSIRTNGIDQPSSYGQAAEFLEKWTGDQISHYSEDSLISGEFRRIQEGTQECREEQAASKENITLCKDPVALKQVLTDYENYIKSQEEEIEKKEQALIGKANNFHNDSGILCEVMRGLRTPIDMELLYICLGRRDLSYLINSNPSLSHDELSTLMNETTELCVFETEIQRLKRACKELRDFLQLLNNNPNASALPSIAQKYFAELNAPRAYDAQNRTDLLVFERYSNKRLRKEQITVLDEMVDPSAAQMLFEARVGFGKSAILLPLWVILSAKPGQLAIMVAPHALFDRQQCDLQKLLYKGYQLLGLRIDFSRETDLSSNELEDLLLELEEAMKNRQIVYMNDKTLHNLFLLKPKEVAKGYLAHPQDELEKRWAALLRLRAFALKSCIAFIDEPHDVCNDQTQNNYSEGMPTPCPTWRLIFGLQIYHALFSKIQGRWRVECWPQATISASDPPADKNLGLLTETDFIALHAEIIQELIDKNHLLVNDEDWAYLLNKMSLIERRQYERRLEKECERETTSAERKIQCNKIRVLYDQLHTYLFQTLQSTADEHYGFADKESSRVAVPLECARKAKKGNEFCALDQMINFTIQANLRLPFSITDIHKFFSELSAQAAQELQDGIKQNISETQAYKKAGILLKNMPTAPKDLLKPQPHEWREIYDYIEQNLYVRLQFIGFYILPHLRIFPEKIISDPHLLMAVFKRIVGASGTLSMQHLPYRFSIKNDKRAMAKMLILLISKYLEAGSPEVVVFDETSSQGIVKALPNQCTQVGLKDPSVVIEIGALLKEYSSLQEMAEHLLKSFPHKKGVATFDEQGALVVYEASSKRFVPRKMSALTDEELIFVYCQKDTTGTDVTLPPLAEAIFLVNEKTTLTHLIQGMGRLRAFDKQQTGRLFVHRDSAIKIRQQLGLAKEASLTHLDLIHFCILRSAQEKGSANVASLSKQWKALVENYFWHQAIHSLPNIKASLVLFKTFWSILVETTGDNPVGRPGSGGEFIDQKEALELLYNEFIEKVLNQLPIEPAAKALIKEEMSKVQQKMEFPSKLQLIDTTSTQSVEANTLVNANVTIEQMMVAMEDTTTQGSIYSDVYKSKIHNRTPIKRYNHMNFWFHSIRSLFSHSLLQPYLPLFPEDPEHDEVELQVNHETIATFEGDSETNPGWVAGYMPPMHYLLIVHDKDHKKIQHALLLHEEQAVHWMGNLEGIHGTLLNQEGKGHYYSRGTLWLINQGVIRSKSGKTSQELRKDPTFRRLELQAKWLNGDLSFTGEQKTTFDTEISDLQKKTLFQFIHGPLNDLHPTLCHSPAYRDFIEEYR